MAKSRAMCKCGCELIAEHGGRDSFESTRDCFKCGAPVKFRITTAEDPIERVTSAEVVPVKEKKVKKVVKKSKKFKAK